MTTPHAEQAKPAISRYLEKLDQSARAASAAEDSFRRDIAKRTQELERERAFAYRRLNMMSALVKAIAGAKDEAEAAAKGVDAFMYELDWNGATESQREVIEKFKPVAVAIWHAGKPDADEQKTDAVTREMDALEKWFSQARNGSFLSLMDKELPNLPLVEIA